MYKTIFFTFIFIFFSWNESSAQQIKVVTYDDQSPPFIYRDKEGELTGIYIEIVKTALSNMPSYQADFVSLPWVRAKSEIESGKAFAILPPYFHAHDWLTEDSEQRPYIWPYSLPLFTHSDIVICNEYVQIKAEAEFPIDYQGLRFVMSNGDGRAGESFSQLVNDKKIELLLVNDIENFFPALFTGIVDCTIMSKFTFAWYKKQIKEKNVFQKLSEKGRRLIVVATIASNDGFLGYSDINVDKNFPFKKDFSIKFDIQIYKMKKNGVIKKIVDRFFQSH